MKAVVLVGGLGTRLRPLTCNTPKPMLPLVNQPFIEHVLEWLRDQGIDEIILAVQYLADRFREVLGNGSRLGVKVHVVEEPAPRGTAGAVKHVEHLLDGTTFVLNGDTLTDVDLRAMLAYHRERGSKLTIALTPVEDPTAYGVVETDADGRIRRFLEKPGRDAVTTNTINAGTYIIEPEVLWYAPAGHYYMFEHGIFPELLRAGDPMYGYASQAYWADIGRPQTYLQVHHDILLGRVHHPFRGRQIAARVWATDGVDIHATAQIDGPVVLGANVRIGPRTHVVGPTVIGDGCMIGADVIIEGSVLWEGNRIDHDALLHSCIIGRNNSIGARTCIREGAVVSDECRIGAENRLERGIRLWPETQLQDRAITFS